MKILTIVLSNGERYHLDQTGGPEWEVSDIWSEDSDWLTFPLHGGSVTIRLSSIVALETL